ncbi:nicotinamide riboside transporter PnuC [Hymenobacter busanensis]|uniref:nicotinamide riboside transporter PnuC n=1 Tax=Hymenobacter busanensis TaxID=2607656 RepID=UPI001367471A|nr:nicotinamide riboside transporter PnuC [Hymenobacter busanensis]QHJ09012.1 nicotinamide riboside transporter PnuC [Hymenobacter busanensis]
MSTPFSLLTLLLSSWFDLWTAAAGNSPVEWVAVLTGLACVWLAARNTVWNFPVAIVSCLIYVLVYHRVQLYSDRNLQLVFVLMSVYGWYQWLRGGPQHAELPISRTRPAEWLWLTAGVAAYTSGFGYYLQHYTDAAFPYVDSFTTGLSLAAQYQLVRKRLENWLVWLLADAIYVPMLWLKGLAPTSGLYFVYLILAAYGYWEWRRTMRSQTVSPLSTLAR